MKVISQLKADLLDKDTVRSRIRDQWSEEIRSSTEPAGSQVDTSRGGLLLKNQTWYDIARR